MDNQNPFTDHAAPVLSADPTLSDESRASLWDAFHNKSADELVQHLHEQDISPDTKQSLFEAKKASMPAPTPHDTVVAAIQRMAQLDPKVLDLAESHPTVLKALTSATATPDKGSKKPASARKASPKDKTPSAVESTPAATPDAVTPPHVIVVAPQTTPSAPPEAAAAPLETSAAPASDSPVSPAVKA